jgi:hypothetical protein
MQVLSARIGATIAHHLDRPQPAAMVRPAFVEEELEQHPKYVEANEAEVKSR